MKKSWVIKMKNLSNIFAVVAALFFVAISIVAITIGGCEKMIETASGGQTPMKCHWSFVAIPFIATIGAISSMLILAGDSKRSKQLLGGLSLLTCAIIAAIPSSIGIGLCGSTSMSCHNTYHVALVLVALSALFSILAIVKAPADDKSQLDIPKAKL